MSRSGWRSHVARSSFLCFSIATLCLPRATNRVTFRGNRSYTAFGQSSQPLCSCSGGTCVHQRCLLHGIHVPILHNRWLFGCPRHDVWAFLGKTRHHHLCVILCCSLLARNASLICIPCLRCRRLTKILRAL